MDVSVVDVPDESRFEIRVDGEIAGVAQYQRRPGVIAFMHTEIDPHFEGRGLASTLIQAALSEARSEGVAVLPFCPFVRAYIARHADYLGLVPGEVRARFHLKADG